MLKRTIRFALLPLAIVALCSADKLATMIAPPARIFADSMTFVTDQEPIYHGRHASYWIEQLKGENASDRKHAAACLMEISSFHGGAEILLRQAIQDSQDVEFRSRASNLLKKIAQFPDDPDAGL